MKVRSLVLIAACALCGCGGDDGSFFTLRVIGSDGAGGRAAIAFSAVDAARIVIDPRENVRFPPQMEQQFEGGDVRTAVSSAGEFVITMERAFLESNLVDEGAGSGFSFDVRLSSDGAFDAPDPLLTVELFQRGDEGQRTIGVFRRSIPWPLPADAVETITVGCEAGLQDACLQP